MRRSRITVRVLATSLTLAVANLAIAAEPTPSSPSRESPPAKSRLNPLAPLIRFPNVPIGKAFVIPPGEEPPLAILYSPAIEPGTFKARLNGRDVTALFHPDAAPGAETVQLPLSDGDNVLEIEVNSKVAAHNPYSPLLPQVHRLRIKRAPVAATVRVGKHRFASKAEMERYLKAHGIALDAGREAPEK